MAEGSRVLHGSELWKSHPTAMFPLWPGVRTAGTNGGKVPGVSPDRRALSKKNGNAAEKRPAARDAGEVSK